MDIGPGIMVDPFSYFQVIGKAFFVKSLDETNTLLSLTK